MLSSTLHVQAALKLAPILPQKSQEMQVVHDLQLYRKTSTVCLLVFSCEGNEGNEGNCITHC